MTGSPSSFRSAALDALPGWLIATGILAASTRTILVARANAAVELPVVADLPLLESAASSPAAWLIASLAVGGIGYGVARRSHITPAGGLLLATVVVYFRVMGTWLEPVTGIVDTRLLAAVMWLYMPQSLAIACLVGHLAIAYRQSCSPRNLGDGA
jgi:hypothetical protein